MSYFFTDQEVDTLKSIFHEYQLEETKPSESEHEFASINYFACLYLRDQQTRDQTPKSIKIINYGKGWRTNSIIDFATLHSILNLPFAHPPSV